MDFGTSISTCLKKYATFTGTASRSEYWWFWLFTLLAQIAIAFVSESLSAVFGIAMLLPLIAAATRRLHETDRSGWWQLIMLVPLLGWIILTVFLCQGPRPNRFGQDNGSGSDTKQNASPDTVVPADPVN